MLEKKRQLYPVIQQPRDAFTQPGVSVLFCARRTMLPATGAALSSKDGYAADGSAASLRVSGNLTLFHASLPKTYDDSQLQARRITNVLGGLGGDQVNAQPI